jgi:sulfite oxidase
MTEFNKHPEYLVRSSEPFNGGAPTNLLQEQDVTPPEQFFVRNHGAVPEVDLASFRLIIDGLVDQELSLSLQDLAERFERVEQMATLQCAGNRRLELIAYKPVPGELPWGEEAISNGVWSGYRLGDVLKAAGLSDEAAHVAFEGLDKVERHGSIFDFGGSIPLSKALSSEVLIADRLNGEALPPVHGFPLRVVAPGYIGARSVKWLRHITVQAAPSDNYFQAHAYKLFPPDVTAATVDWEKGEMLGELYTHSVISQPTAGAELSAGLQTIKGYAYAGGDAVLTGVEVSIDGGQSWQAARFTQAPRQYVWAHWEAEIELPAGSQQIAVRASDNKGSQQPAEVASVWNFKGYMNNAWHRIEVKVS